MKKLYSADIITLREGRRTNTVRLGHTQAHSLSQAKLILEIDYPYPGFLVENVRESPVKKLPAPASISPVKTETAKSCVCQSYGEKPNVPDAIMGRALIVISNTDKKLPAIEWAEFKRGYVEELEHGCRSPATNITCDDPIMTAKIVLAHLVEDPHYYTNLGLGGDNAGKR